MGFFTVAPKLREVRFYPAFRGYKSLSVESLRTLKLSFPSVLDAIAWLHGIKGLRGLECLHLLTESRGPTAGALSQWNRAPGSTPAPPVSFPRLRELLISSTASYFTKLFSCLTISSSCSVTIECARVNLTMLGKAISALLSSNAHTFTFDTTIMTYGIFITLTSINTGPQYKLHLLYKDAYQSLRPFEFIILLTELCLRATPQSLHVDFHGRPPYTHNFNFGMKDWNVYVRLWLELVCALGGVRRVGLVLPPCYYPAHEGEHFPFVEVPELERLDVTASGGFCKVVLRHIGNPKDCVLRLTTFEHENDIGKLQVAVIAHLAKEEEACSFNVLFMLDIVHVFLSPASHSKPRHEFHLRLTDSTLDG